MYIEKFIIYRDITFSPYRPALLGSMTHSWAHLNAEVSRTTAPLACFFFFLSFRVVSSARLSAMWECLRLQTSVALLDRSSVSAGLGLALSATVPGGSVSFSRALLLLLRHIIVFSFHFLNSVSVSFWLDCFSFVLKKIFCSLYRRHYQIHDHRNKSWQQPEWIVWRMDGRQMGCCSIFTCHSPPGGAFIKMFLFSLQSIKIDCYDYLTVCPSHFSPHLSSCEYGALWGFSLSLCISCSLSRPISVCHVHHAGG